jgi:hypothetical protein
MKIRNTNPSFGMEIEFGSVEEMASAMSECSPEMAESAKDLREGRDYEIIEE